MNKRLKFQSAQSNFVGQEIGKERSNRRATNIDRSDEQVKLFSFAAIAARCLAPHRCQCLSVSAVSILIHHAVSKIFGAVMSIFRPTITLIYLFIFTSFQSVVITMAVQTAARHGSVNSGGRGREKSVAVLAVSSTSSSALHCSNTDQPLTWLSSCRSPGGRISQLQH